MFFANISGILLFFPLICSFGLLYFPETGVSRHIKRKVSKESGSKVDSWVFTVIFFVLCNTWAALIILANELQIHRNKILPGENQWGSGQILAMLLIIIPLLGCISVGLQSLGALYPGARRRIKVCKILTIDFEIAQVL